ncbi:hypothetical protein H6G81_21305 [Scytonema hofmannii FACHB-248]|uniref:Uncharacterized protein n=1 Tax=Scytonema hofmannii FACHB-248 TaxID=1842502 RepID=A0ABR8GUF1_9CYAN|nr:hypothetical protein [Scytonema hofmannii FACHB-248]
MSVKQHNSLFRLASKLLKYFLLALLGFMIAYVLSTSLGGLHIVFLMMYLLRPLILFGIIALCLFTTAIIFESWR